MVSVQIKKIHPEAIIPSYGHPGDVGLELYSVEGITLRAGKRATIATGIAMEVPEGYAILIWPRSGLSAKQGIDVLAGVIDPHYRGEYKVVLLNTSEEDYEIKKGDRIAQALIQPVEHANIEEVTELSGTTRGTGGFGSTGR